MPDFASIGAFVAHVDKFRDEMTTGLANRVAMGAAKKLQTIATQEASRDLGGDPKFSGWAPTLETRVVKIDTGKVAVTPTKRSAGPWTVANDGRHQGNAGGFSGPGINRSTGLTARTKSGGVRKTRARKGRRWNGTTRGKGTADRVVGRADGLIGDVVNVEFVKTLGKFFD